MGKSKFTGFFIFLLSASFLFPAYADTIKLRDGKTVDGKILEKTGQYVKIDSAGVALTYYPDEIESINQGAANEGANETDPHAILEKVKAKYKSLKTYKTHGTVTMDTGSAKLHTDFNMMLKKPNQYLISWTPKMPMSVMWGGVWNEGTQPYIYMGLMNAYSKMSSDEIALASATGVSQGVAFTMPSVFLEVFKKGSSILDTLVNPVLDGVEKVEDKDCYVISGSAPHVKKETLWVSRSEYLIIKHFYSFETQQGGEKKLEMTDAQLDALLKNMGVEGSPEIKQKMKDRMKRSEEAPANTKAQGSVTTIYVDISSPEMGNADFQFKLPEGAVLKESLLGEILGGNN